MPSEAHQHSSQSGLRGKTVLIVGGSSGIGLATARQASAVGASVLVAGRDPARARRVAAENGFAAGLGLDVTDPATIAAALAGLEAVDHLVLLAGSFAVGKVLDAEIAQLHRAFDERVWAAVHVLRALGGRLAADASITFVSGVLAERPNAHGTALLGAASAAMDALARGLALELAPRRVNTVSPGMTDTPLLGAALGENRDSTVEAVRNGLPLKRIATADEVGAAIVFLMQNGSMNGETLHVDGGSRLV